MNKEVTNLSASLNKVLHAIGGAVHDKAKQFDYELHMEGVSYQVDLIAKQAKSIAQTKSQMAFRDGTIVQEIFNNLSMEQKAKQKTLSKAAMRKLSTINLIEDK